MDSQSLTKIRKMFTSSLDCQFKKKESLPKKLPLNYAYMDDKKMLKLNGFVQSSCVNATEHSYYIYHTLIIRFLF